MQLTVGGDRINYPHDVSTPTEDATTAKCVINSTISTPGAKCMCFNVKNFYLRTPMDWYEYMWLPMEIIPEEIMSEYDLHKLVHNNQVYLEVRKGMYGLPQAGILVNKLLTKLLATKEHRSCRHTPGLWKHK
jgi:hypothetical protein